MVNSPVSVGNFAEATRSTDFSGLTGPQSFSTGSEFGMFNSKAPRWVKLYIFSGSMVKELISAARLK
jgi:hypothetical protein